MRVLDEETMNRVAEYNIRYQREHGRSPSFRNVMHALGLGSLATVQRYVRALERRGSLELEKDGSIQPLPSLLSGESTIVPLVGEIACGEPNYGVENIEESFALPKALFGDGDLFMLRMQHATNHLDNPTRISATRRDIARVKTVIREKQLGR